jgi:putative transposase
MPMSPMSPNLHRGLRFPSEVIQHAVWSLRFVELILVARGIIVSYKSIREWGLQFGGIFANTLKRRWPQPGDKWYMDEVFISIRGKQQYLWRPVDQDGDVLDILVQSRRSTTAAKRFFRKLLKGLRYVPRTSSRATPRPSGRSCRTWSTAKAGISIIAPRCPSSRHDDENDR